MMLSRNELRDLLRLAESSETGRVMLPCVGFRLEVYEVERPPSPDVPRGHMYGVVRLESGAARPERLNITIAAPATRPFVGGDRGSR